MDKVLLEIEMKRNGYTASQLAKAIGIDRSTFSKKINGVSEFKQSEMEAIIRVLKIDNPTPIFFAKKVS